MTLLDTNIAPNDTKSGAYWGAIQHGPALNGPLLSRIHNRCQYVGEKTAVLFIYLYSVNAISHIWLKMASKTTYGPIYLQALFYLFFHYP